MSGSATITAASPPITSSVAATMLAYMYGQSGVITDINIGAILRTLAESFGSVVEEQSTIDEALAFQAIVYAGFGAFGVTADPALPSVGAVTFATGSGGSPPASPVAVSIASGTIVQTQGGVQFSTTANVVLALGGTSVSAPVQAVSPGIAGNVASGTVTVIATGLPAALVVTNPLPMANGTAADTPADLLAEFTAKVAALGLASPVSIANACIGVTASGSAEAVEYATVYEAWKANGTTVAGFTVYIDNGSGTASSGLIAAVVSLLNGSFALNQSGYRPAGVPYSVVAVTPVLASIVVVATLIDSSQQSAINAAVTSAVQSYFASLNFGIPAEVSQVIASVASALAGEVSSFSVTMLDSTSTSQQVITPTSIERLLLTGVNTSGIA